MYKLSTYFYWSIIVSLRVISSLQFWALWSVRGVILKLLERIFLEKYQVKLIFAGNKRVEQGEIETLQPVATGVSTTSRPVIKVIIRDKNLLLRIISEGTLPLGEGLKNHQIECESVEDFTLRIIQGSGSVASPLFKLRDWVYLNSSEFPWDSNSDSSNWITDEAKTIIRQIMGKYLNFISGYWDSEDLTLETALTRNMENIGRKLKLEPGMKILDLGCGTGIFANYLAEKYDVNVIGINISKDEVDLALKNAHPNVKIRLADYRELPKEWMGTFDRIVSIHLLEHIGGPKYYPEYFDILSKYLKPNGKGRLYQQSIVTVKPLPVRVDMFLRKYLLPHQVTATTMEVLKGMTDSNLVIENIESTGHYYSRTGKEYLKILKSQKDFGVDKKSLWTYEIGAKIAIVLFGCKHTDVWQIVAATNPQHFSNN